MKFPWPWWAGPIEKVFIVIFGLFFAVGVPVLIYYVHQHNQEFDAAMAANAAACEAKGGVYLMNIYTTSSGKYTQTHYERLGCFKKDAILP